MNRQRETANLSFTEFPPPPLSERQSREIARKYCDTLALDNFVEAGCAVCGYLTPLKMLTPLKSYAGDLSLLECEGEGVTRKERFSLLEPIEELQGPVLAKGCSHICVECQCSIDAKMVPKLALANHNWIGDVPEPLKDLSYAEGLMIAKVRHNRTVVRVNSGRVRMNANAIMFSQPVLKVYLKLPPSVEEMNEILAFVFTGSAPPTPEDFDRTPMLGYQDLEISQENLMAYPEHGIPVVVDYRKSKNGVHDSVPIGATAVNEDVEEQGTTSGPCSFAVHGLTSEEYAGASMTTIKHVALQHLMRDGKMLGIGRSEKPVSMYNTVEAYPGMFPWLFPYGKGGIGHPTHNHKQADIIRKKSLLMYHDKRFQMDTYFPMIAFNHEQMKAASWGSKLVAKRSGFHAIVRRLRNVDPNVAENIANRMVNGEHVRLSNEAEQTCFDVIRDLDSVGGHVMGSITSKKYMRSEIWSTVALLYTRRKGLGRE
ncbi:hypothetical protein DFH06DRAFT_1002091 [Mycena polygramma]|nr:hypothetical protein DFH06DRAFT_1002091 [Mycena polygramma]